MKHLFFFILVAGWMSFTTIHAQMTGVTFEVDTIFGPGAVDDWGNSLEGFVTYDFFAEFANPTDELAAIFASNVPLLTTSPMYVDAPCGCFNPELADVLLGGQQNVFVLAAFPSMAFDTYWTVGFASGEQGVFNNGLYSSTTMCSEQEEDGVIFTMTPEAAGDDLQIQFAQITTCGSIELHACFQVFVEGDQGSSQEWCMEGDGEGPLFVTELNTEPGCTNAEACNFDPTAGVNDGSCIYPLIGNDCEAGAVACDETTTWNAVLQQCECSIEPEENDCPSDLNGNGLVEVTDLLLVLGDFGMECPE